MLFRTLGGIHRKMRSTAGRLQGKVHLLTALLLTSVMISTPAAWGDVDQAGEYQVKAAYLYHFAKFIEWPSDAAGSASQTLTVCVVGNSPFGRSFASISGKTVRGRRVAITYIRRIEELEACDILFVSVSEKAKLGQILAAVASRPILTISDIKRFVSAGGMIGFVSLNDKVRFEINQRAAQRSGLRISAQLLKLATMVVEQ